MYLGSHDATTYGADMFQIQAEQRTIDNERLANLGETAELLQEAIDLAERIGTEAGRVSLASTVEIKQPGHIFRRQDAYEVGRIETGTYVGILILDHQNQLRFAEEGADRLGKSSWPAARAYRVHNFENDPSRARFGLSAIVAIQSLTKWVDQNHLLTLPKDS